MKRELDRVDRRTFVRRTTQVVAGCMLGSMFVSAKAVSGVEFSSSTTGRCATCAFWGAKRRISTDGRFVLVQSLGWCNNPNSKHFQRQTAPGTGPMQSWRKWAALG